MDVRSWCEDVAVAAFQEEATANGLAVLYEMCAALVGDDAATRAFEYAATVTDRFRR